MLYSEKVPCDLLKPYIKCFWHLESSSTEVDTILPDGCMELIVHFGASYQRLNDTLTEMQQRTFVFGQIDRSIKLQPLGKSNMLGVRFKPYGLSAFTSIPINDFTWLSVSLEDVWGQTGLELEEQLHEHTGIEKHIDILERFFTAQLVEKPRVEALDYAVNCLKSSGNNSLSDLSYRLNIGERQLQRLFLRHVGLGPKKLKRIYRLQNTISLAQSGSIGSLTEVALAAGYYDQAHFNHDFRAMVGLSPKDFFKEDSGIGKLFLG